MIFVLFQYIGLRSYDQQMPDLVAPTIRLQDAWREAHEEWGPGMHEDGFGLLSEDDVESSVGFAAWLKRLSEQSDPARRLDHVRFVARTDGLLKTIKCSGGSRYATSSPKR
jgi:hypothetical protein